MRLKPLLFVLVLVGLSLACSLSGPTVVRPEPPIENLVTPLPVEETPNVLVPVEPDEKSKNAPPATPPNNTVPALATPASDSPTAGICAEFEGEWVTVTIHPDIPDPRCSIIRPEQKLEVVNMRGETLHIKIGQMETDLENGEGHRFDIPFGDYLLAGGVHRINVQPCCGAELVFEKGQ